jgi:two-component system sensor histidine kinase/response regulator
MRPPPVIGEASRLILVAEDSEISQNVIRRQLEMLGYSTHIHANGQDALDCTFIYNYALLLTDLHMPIMDGYELTAQIRKRETVGVRLPILALTANTVKGEAERCRGVGMDDYMTKPLQLAELHAMLMRWAPLGAKPLPLRAPRIRKLRARSNENSLSTPTQSPATGPAVDLKVLNRLVGDEPAVLRDLLAIFLRTATVSSEAIRAGIAVGSNGAIAHAAHTLKSGARAIGAADLGVICEEIERSAEAGRSIDLAEQLVRFDAAYEDVHRFLDPYAA